MADISRLSNNDLRAISEGRMGDVSDYGLKVIAGEDVLSPEQIQEQQRRAAISMGRAESPALAKAADIAAGLTGTLRGALPKSMEERFFPTEGIDRSSAEYIGSSILDPYALAIGGGFGTLAAKAIPATTTAKKILSGMLGGAGAGGVVGGLSEEGSAGMGGMLGGVVGAGIPIAGKLGRFAGDVGSLVSASFGRQSGIDKLAADSAKRLVGPQAQRIEQALQNATEIVPGARPTVAEAIAQQTVGKPEQFGGALVRMQKTLSGAKEGLEDILPTASRAQVAAIESFKTGIENTYAPVRNAILKQANKRGVDTTQILNSLDTMITAPGDREAKMLKSVLPALRTQIENLKQSSPNIVDARDLYAIRKNLGAQIKQASKETGSWDKKLGSYLERQVQLAIDDAIDAATGGAWSPAYMQPYAERMGYIRAHEERLKEAKNIMKEVKSRSPADLIKGEVPQVPTLLSRPMMAINFAVKSVLGDANTPVAKEMAKRMADPKEFAKLIALPQGNPTGDLARKIASAMVVSGVAQQGDSNQ